MEVNQTGPCAWWGREAFSIDLIIETGSSMPVLLFLLLFSAFDLVCRRSRFRVF